VICWSQHILLTYFPKTVTESSFEMNSIATLDFQTSTWNNKCWLVYISWQKIVISFPLRNSWEDGGPQIICCHWQVKADSETLEELFIAADLLAVN